MPSFELSKLQGATPARGLSESDRAQLGARRAPAASGSGAASGKPGVALEIRAAIDPSTPPVDADRVAQIRKALKDGTYPLVPARIADAIIAARMGPGVSAK
jgi:negative regulator of flagellin synthesis FlgM